MLTLVRNIPLEPGRNHLGLSAEHELLGLCVQEERSGPVLHMAIAENTKISDTPDGLVYRDVYVVLSGEYLPFGLKDVIQTLYYPGSIGYMPRAVFVLPSRKQ